MLPADPRPCCTALCLQEGQEPPEFFTRLGGKAAYPRVNISRGVAVEPRLYHLLNHGSRGVQAQLLPCVSQDSLCGDDVMLMDVGTEVCGGVRSSWGCCV